MFPSEFSGKVEHRNKKFPHKENYISAQFVLDRGLNDHKLGQWISVRTWVRTNPYCVMLTTLSLSLSLEIAVLENKNFILGYTLLF